MCLVWLISSCDDSEPFIDRRPFGHCSYRTREINYSHIFLRSCYVRIISFLGQKNKNGEIVGYSYFSHRIACKALKIMGPREHDVDSVDIIAQKIRSETSKYMLRFDSPSAPIEFN